MKKFIVKQFEIPILQGISQKNIEEHLKLYAGYVKNTNLIIEQLSTLSFDENNIYLITELNRRLSFEFGGVRNHEYYFSSLEQGARKLNPGPLQKSLIENFNSPEEWLEKFKTLALTRGIGWAMLVYDLKTEQLLNHWVDEQHIGHLVSTVPILCLDMWEHAFVYDYPTSEKKKYVDAFFDNLNWEVIEKNFNLI